MNSLKGKSWFSQFGQILTAIVLGVALVACGGGKKSDRTPDPFSFTAQTDVELSTAVESNAITVTDINKSVAISVTGGEYSIAGGAFTSAAGTVTNGQSVTVRLTSSDSYSTQSSATLTIGGVSGTFNVTTLDDTTPDAFAFAAQTEVELNTQVSSSEFTISGINVATPIMVTGGEYSIDGGEFSDADGTIENDQAVVVRQTSSADLETTTQATLTIGGVEGTFAVTTLGKYNFEGFTGVALNARLQTHIVTIDDIGDSTPISIENGEYQLDRGEWTDQAGFIDNGQEVRVRAIAGDDYSVKATARLNVGESWGVFGVTTKENGDFISVWKTDNRGASEDNQITLPLEADGTYDFTVDWGDGSSSQITQSDQAEATHTYPQVGEYVVIIRGEITGFRFDSRFGDDEQKIIEVSQWGALKLGSGSEFFRNASNLVFTGNDALDLFGVSSTNFMFSRAINFTGELGNWDVSNVTEMERMFEDVSSFNPDISQWDVSSVTDMTDMFSNSGVSAQNYSAALIAWSQLPNIQENVTLGAEGVFYNATAENARDFLSNDKGWTITDEGLEPQ